MSSINFNKNKLPNDNDVESSQQLFISYLNKYLEANFFRYPQELVPDLFQYFIAVKSLLIADIRAKSLQFTSNKLLNNEIFDSLQLDITLEAIFYYRLERAIFLACPEHPLLPYLANLMRIRTGIEIYYTTEIGAGFSIYHGTGIVIGPRHKIGKNFIIHQGVTLGQKRPFFSNESIVIGNNVIVFAGAKIIGNVTIGDNVIIGANSVLLSDAETNYNYAGIPARKI